MAEPLYVTFCRVVLGWTALRDIETRPHVTDQPLWVGTPPEWQPALDEADWKVVPRVDLPGYDLGPWEAVNKLEILYGLTCVIVVPNHCDTGEYQVRVLTDHAHARREAVLRCLVVLFEVGKGMRP